MNQYAVWGNPIAQSKSPQIHRLFAQQAKKNIHYQRKLSDDLQFEQQLLAFFENGAKGANITAPFKEKAFAIADIHSKNCLQAEACNTLMRLDDGRLYADNTDGLGLLSDLTRLGWLNPDQNILILGVGGATKGVLAHLLRSKQRITLYNRTHQKAVSLANKFANLGKIKVKSFEELFQQSFDLVINATSLGLQGKYIELPQTILRNANVYDMQYAPYMQTPFLNYAHSQGAKACQDGLGMLVGQASYAFELWEGVLPEINPVLAQLRFEMEN